jgi:hypothetical protein
MPARATASGPHAMSAVTRVLVPGGGSRCPDVAGRKVLGFYLPMRFDAGEPFHAGAAWQLMDVGLKAMAGALAD